MTKLIAEIGLFIGLTACCLFIYFEETNLMTKILFIVVGGSLAIISAIEAMINLKNMFNKSSKDP